MYYSNEKEKEKKKKKEKGCVFFGFADVVIGGVPSRAGGVGVRYSEKLLNTLATNKEQKLKKICKGEGVLNDSVKEHSFSRRCVQGLAELLNHILSFGACLCFDLVYNQSESLLQQHANFGHISTYANISHPLNITLLSL